MTSIELLIALVGMHFLCDYVFQTDAIATGKNRHLDSAKFGVNWYYWMSSHAITHGFGVGILTGSVWLGLAETVLHWIIDAGKCEKVYGLHTDQVLHFGCKLLWVVIIFA